MTFSRKLPVSILLLLVLVGLCASGSLLAADSPFWPRFHGPKGDNISTDTGLLKAWPEEGPELAWTGESIGHGYAGVTMADGQIYTDGNIDEMTVITAMDMGGRIVWQRENGKAWTASREGSRGTPTVDGDHVYHESPLGDVVCLDAKTGKRVWGLNILDEFGSRHPRWALAESLLIDGDHVICCPCGEEVSVVALDKRTGRTVWKARGTGDLAGYASPTLAECGGLRLIFAMTAKALIAVNADTGELLFQFENPTEHDVNALMPLYHDGRVFISSGYGTTGSTLVKLSVDGDRVTPEKVWNSRELDNHHGGVILLDGYLYGAAHDFNRQKWICLDWKTGELQYAERGVGKGSLTCADGMLYTLSENRNVGLVKPTPDGHELVSEFRTPDGPEGPTWAHPVVCGGRLYIRHSDKLYAYNVRGE
jgi:outer membrane protein assembly factor BamB